MVTTGFWPVKNRLKEVIDYARNPDKTTDKKYLDEDLYNALRYVENDNKTDKKMYVSGINCPTKRAYQYMIATKQRYGKLGGNVAYHGYQSFVSGEVTPEEAHAIGMETARRMWGKDYEIVVTTHLNTDNLHNHIVVNSVSFRTGRKFENHISDHYKLREISDAVCLERGKSVLPPTKFTGSRKKDYWVHKNGGLTHRDILKRDIESILPYCGNMDDIECRLHSLGYQFPRNRDYEHISIIAPGWKRAIRLDSLGYTNEVLRKRIYENRSNERFYVLRNNNPPFRPKVYPLLILEKKLDYEITHSKDTAVVLVDVLFYILLQLLNLTRDEQELQRRNQPLSPSIRQSLTIEEKLLSEYAFLKANDLHSTEDILNFIDNRTSEIASLEAERQKIRNGNRRPNSDEERQAKNTAAREISKKLMPLRKELKLAESALERYPQVWELLKTERDAEIKSRNRNRERER